jgi:hypothetical protein
MKNIKIFATLIALITLSSCATIYKSPVLSSRISNHNKIAFLPFDAVIRFKKMPKNTTIEQVKEMEEDMGYVFQEQMFTRFLKKINHYNVEFQDVSMTNALLKKNNITYSNFKEYTKEEIAKILKVDAVVSGKILSTKPMSEGGAIVIGLLTGIGTSTNKVDVNISLYDALDSKLLFKYDHTYSGGIGSSPESISKALMRSIEKKFPYRN